MMDIFRDDPFFNPGASGRGNQNDPFGGMLGGAGFGDMSKMMQGMMGGGMFGGGGGMMGGGMMGGGTMGRMNEMMKGLDQGKTDPNAMCSSQSHFYSSSQGPDGKPHVIRKSLSNRRAGNVHERKEASSDSKTGVERMARQRGLGDQSRKVMRGRNGFGSEEVQDDVCVNMDAADGNHFEQKWEQAAHRAGLHGGRQGKQLGYQPHVSIGGANQTRAPVSGRHTRLPSHMSNHQQRGNAPGGRRNEQQAITGGRRNEQRTGGRSNASAVRHNGPPSIGTLKR